MKIIILNNDKLRMEFLDVPDNMVGDEVETFLAKHGYSLNSISWMAANTDSMPIVFRTYRTDPEDGSETVSQRETQIGDFSVRECIKELGVRDKAELIETVRKHGQEKDGGYVYDFEKPGKKRPAVCIYEDAPYEMGINNVSVDKDGTLSLYGFEFNSCEEEYIDLNDVFVGELQTIIECIVE